MTTEKPVDPKPPGLYDDRAELWYVATGIINSHETGDDLKQMALGIRQQLRLEARVNELTELFYQVKAERDALIRACQSWDEGFVDGEQFTPDQFRIWVNDRRRMVREALAKVKGLQK